MKRQKVDLIHTSRRWWLRSSLSASGYWVGIVNYHGDVKNYTVYSNDCVLPVCVIV